MQGSGESPEFTKADRLRKARECAGLEQAELAERLGVARNTVSTAERGVNSPRRIIVRAWALATGVPLYWIETGRVPSPDGDGTHMLPRLDSNQQPFGYKFLQVRPITKRSRSYAARPVRTPVAA
ncbi:helix-turn-helix transcriptional regulator [Devriesea agamarum]|uniref:helix-turn-helix transcriptional regulator n=1 Tax=Devriesea agamarum TaxID=472569 RepID=UPI000A04E52E